MIDVVPAEEKKKTKIKKVFVNIWKLKMNF